MIPRRQLWVLAGAASLLFGCVPDELDLVLSEKSAVELRAMQSRAFETGDKPKVYRAVLETLQDLGYVVTDADPKSGTVSGNKLAQLNLTATVYSRPSSAERIIVRVNATVRVTPGHKQEHQVDDPEFYQSRFFEPLSKALFLTALKLED